VSYPSGSVRRMNDLIERARQWQGRVSLAEAIPLVRDLTAEVERLRARGCPECSATSWNALGTANDEVAWLRAALASVLWNDPLMPPAEKQAIIDAAAAALGGEGT